MSHQYKHNDEIPNSVLAARLDELSRAVTEGPEARDREFTMRIPAECDRDADLVLAAAAARLRHFDALAPYFRAVAGAASEDAAVSAARGLVSAVAADLDACLAGEHAAQACAMQGEVVARRGEG